MDSLSHSFSLVAVDELTSKEKKVADGSILAEAGIEESWLYAYGMISRRFEEDFRLGISRYLYEQRPHISPFNGGFFEHINWPLHKDLENPSIMRLIADYEANYINGSFYWISIH